MVLPLVLGAAAGMGGLLSAGFRYASRLQAERAAAEVERRRALLDEAAAGGDPLASPEAGARFGLRVMADPGLTGVGASLLDDFARARELEYARGTARMGDEAALARQAAGDEAAMLRQRESDRAALERLQMQEQGDWMRSQLGARAAAEAAQYGSVPAGYTRTTAPGGGVIDIPNPGTADFARAMDPILSTGSALRAVTELRDSVERYGSELVGPESKRQGLLYERALRALADMQEAGVMQEGERAAMEEALPNPSRLGSVLTRRASMMQAYDTLMGELIQRGANKWALSPFGVAGQPMPAEWQAELDAREARARGEPLAVPPGFEEVQ